MIKVTHKRKHLIWGLLTISEVYSIIIMAESMAAHMCGFGETGPGKGF